MPVIIHAKRILPKQLKTEYLIEKVEKVLSEWGAY